jgi:hypothetical protein
MPKQVLLSDQTVAGLKRHAEPLEDSYDSVIGRLIEFFESRQNSTTRPMFVAVDDGPRQFVCQVFDASNPPDLKHTKLTAARVAETQLANPNWNGLLDEVLRRGFMAFGGSFENLHAVCPVNMVSGKKTNEGYHYLKELDFSVQGQDANGAWKGAAFLAQMIDCPVEVQFVWRLKEGAANPGGSGRFEIPRSVK